MITKIHHLNCGTMCPFSKRLVNGEGSLFEKGRLICHCLLIEKEDKLILIDSGLGTLDIKNRSKFRFFFKYGARPMLDVRETAVEQIKRLGYQPNDVSDIVLTHLHIDHAGGIADFPDARIHVFKDELDFVVRENPPNAYQWRHRPKWITYDLQGEEWNGFDAVKTVDRSDDILLIPLAGHTVGHCGIVTGAADKAIFHCGDLYYHHRELEGKNPPVGLMLFEKAVDKDQKIKNENLAQVRNLFLKNNTVKIINSHDYRYFDAPV